METIENYGVMSLRKKFNETARGLGNGAHPGLGDFLTKKRGLKDIGMVTGIVGAPLVDAYLTTRGGGNVPLPLDVLLVATYAVCNFPFNVIEAGLGGMVGRELGRQADVWLEERVNRKNSSKNPYQFE